MSYRRPTITAHRNTVHIPAPAAANGEKGQLAIMLHSRALTTFPFAPVITGDRPRSQYSETKTKHTVSLGDLMEGKGLVMRGKGRGPSG